jgi:predicted site-specific integrase-resolvase
VKLSDYARLKGVSYRTAWRWFKDGLLNAEQMPTGTIIVQDQAVSETAIATVVYARVSAAENKTNLDAQAERVSQYCIARGYQIKNVVKEIGSGVNDQRPKVIKLLADQSVKRIVVEHKDRLTRFGFNYIDTLLKLQGRSVEVVNLADNGKEDLIQDFISIITSFCARIYGQRKSKRKTEKIIAELTNN